MAKKRLLDPAERGRKGGRARVRAMTAGELRAAARRAAQALNKSRTPAERQAAARKAVLARWAREKDRRRARESP